MYVHKYMSNLSTKQKAIANAIRELIMMRAQEAAPFRVHTRRGLFP